jgi:cell wall-associated NlpC family hydrolase
MPQKSVGKLVCEVERHLGEPYRYGGTSHRGWDCSGFVRMAFLNSLKIKLPRSAEEMLAYSRKIGLSRARAGDLVFFTLGEHKASHVGIYLGNHNFAHVSIGRGVVKSSLDDEYYRRHLIGIGRIPYASIAASR